MTNIPLFAICTSRFMVLVMEFTLTWRNPNKLLNHRTKEKKQTVSRVLVHLVVQLADIRLHKQFRFQDFVNHARDAKVLIASSK